MTATISVRRLILAMVLLLLVAIFVGSSPRKAWAIVPGLTATVNNPTPNPVPAGETATTTIVFSLAADSGPINVGVELQAAAGFGALRLDAAGTSPELVNCVETPTQVTCDWDGESVESPQTLAIFIDVDPATAPGSGANLAAIASSVTEPVEVYNTAFISVLPPLGSTSMSGTVITEGGAPVAQACVYLLSAPSFVFPTITDSTGAWVLTDLPDNYSFAVGVIPPFDIGFGPCASNGPPPVPAPGELQPVFFEDIWVDLADPGLSTGQVDPYVFAVNAGATVFTGTNSGIETCLSTAPPEAVPRPPCIAAVTTTTTSTTITTTTVDVGAGGGSTTTLADILPVTGPTQPMTAVAGAAAIVIGSALLLIASLGRRRD